MSDQVEKVLRDRNVYFIASGNDYLTKCFNPDHEDSHPSFRIDKVKGIGHCFSCGHKVNIFKHFGIIANMVNIKVVGIKEKLNALRQAGNGLDMLPGSTPITAKFRGISVETLTKFEIFSTDLVPNMDARIILPIKDIKGRIKAFIGRHTLSNANPRYVIHPRGAILGMVPPILDTSSKYLVLVEGMFDMLNMYDKGLKSVSATMGTNTLNNDYIGEKMLSFKAQGVTHIFMCYDGDDAGIAATKSITPKLEACGFVVETIQLAEGDDPGGLSEQEVRDIKNYIETKIYEQSHVGFAEHP